jgi:hypothetical protein
MDQERILLFLLLIKDLRIFYCCLFIYLLNLLFINDIIKETCNYNLRAFNSTVREERTKEIKKRKGKNNIRIISKKGVREYHDIPFKRDTGYE